MQDPKDLATREEFPNLPEEMIGRPVERFEDGTVRISRPATKEEIENSLSSLSPEERERVKK